MREGGTVAAVVLMVFVTPLPEYNKDGYRLDHCDFFMDRFGPAFGAELEAFFHAISNGKPPGPGSNDALESLKTASSTRTSRFAPATARKQRKLPGCAGRLPLILS
jgi:hypothetical protein